MEIERLVQKLTEEQLIDAPQKMLEQKLKSKEIAHDQDVKEVC